MSNTDKKKNSAKSTKSVSKSENNKVRNVVIMLSLGAFLVVNIIFLIVNIKIGNDASDKESRNKKLESELAGLQQSLDDKDKELQQCSIELKALSEALTTEETTTEAETVTEKEITLIQREYPEYDEEQLRKITEIRENPSRYPEDLLLLIHKNHETLDFVYDYPLKKNAPVDNDITAELKVAEEGKIPLFLQWDERWGYMKYGDGFMSNNGCGPTSLAMVVVYMTGNKDATPAKIAKYADDNGYYYDGVGTAWSLLNHACMEYGVYAKEIGFSEEAMIEAVTTGHPLVAIVGRGDFTDGGHFIVITGYEDGEFTVNDPNSIIRSNMKWSFARLYHQIDGLWAYYKY
ncbi:MAG: C39 family peptidase [Eubacterium sp.]|nr:C39 family peptidase [Eubacterium sp.]